LNQLPEVDRARGQSRSTERDGALRRPEQLRRVRPPLESRVPGAARVAGLAGDARDFLLTNTATERAARLHMLALDRENDFFVYY